MSYLPSYQPLSNTPNDSPYDLDHLHTQQFIDFHAWPLAPEGTNYDIPITLGLGDAPHSVPVPAQQQLESALPASQAVLSETRSRYKGVTPKSSNAKNKSRQKKSDAVKFVSNFKRVV